MDVKGIYKDKEGRIIMEPDFDMGYTDPMTGSVFVVLAKDVCAKGAAYVIRMGAKQSCQDSRAGIKDHKEADKTVAARVAAIKAGTVREGGGGRKADEVVNEAIVTLRGNLGMGIKAFTDAFGTGRDAIAKVCAKEVNDAVAAHVKAGHTKPSKEAIVARLDKTIKAVMDKAQSRVDERKVDKIEITF